MNDDERRLGDFLHGVTPQPPNELDADEIMRSRRSDQGGFRYWPQFAAAAAVVAVVAGTAIAVNAIGGDHANRSRRASAPVASRPGSGKPTVVLGDKNFPEQYVLGELYAQALRAKGFTVHLKSDIGSSTVVDHALATHKIGLYPEYTGVIYSELAGHKNNARSAAQALAGATTYENKRGRAVLDPTRFQDTDGVAVSRTYANKHGLRTIADLSKVGSFRFGGPPEDRDRYQGVVGLRKLYGLGRLKFVKLQYGTTYSALDKGKADAIAVYTSDGELAGGKYTLLTDTLALYSFEQVVPVVNKSVLAAEGPAFARTLDAVSRVLTPVAMQKLNRAVVTQERSPSTVAHQFLVAHKLG